MLAVRPGRALEQERQRIAHQNGRALSHDEPGTLTLQEWVATLDYFRWRCAYCDGPYEVLEHYWPIGSGHGTTVKNCLPACKRCNTRKSDRTPYAGLTSGQRLKAANFFSVFAPERGAVIDVLVFATKDGNFGQWHYQKQKRAGKV